ncbi:SixA phosphatase family protein [Fuerstiella marisgermanici]|uniref:Phosphohistidine phosphatase n=1 Tax=Fuerstiella marisgermanici TaxID=1891926 RepID=A0A1P8WBG8_9PLAN|nr:histidine phosphatase family protein [Fuerstiella marisgermanici]APZ91376.1 phosphohistidine phosphatase [Fuerstiella marisgermanici]
MAKHLILMRHSYAASNNPAWSDHERPLTERGRQLATSTAAMLSDFRIDRIVHSDAVRTTQTAELIKKACGHDPPLYAAAQLYHASASENLNEAVQNASADDDGIMVVGHNPGMAGLIYSLSHESLPISPGSVAIFRLNGNDWKLLQDGSEAVTLTTFISGGVRQDHGTECP